MRNAAAHSAQNNYDIIMTVRSSTDPYVKNFILLEDKYK